MKYANLIAATHFSSVGTAAFSEDSAFEDGPFVARHFHSATPFAPLAIFFFLFYLCAATLSRDVEQRGEPSSRYDFLPLCLVLSTSIPDKIVSCLSLSFGLTAPTQLLEPPTLPGIVSCMLCVLCGGLNLLRGVHAIESILQVGAPKK